MSGDSNVLPFVPKWEIFPQSPCCCLGFGPDAGRPCACNHEQRAVKNAARGALELSEKAVNILRKTLLQNCDPDTHDQIEGMSPRQLAQNWVALCENAATEHWNPSGGSTS